MTFGKRSHPRLQQRKSSMHDKDKEKQQNNNQQERSSIRKSTTNEGEMPQLSSSYHPSTSSSTSNSTPSSQTQRHQPFTTSPTLDIGFAERGGEGVGAVASPLFKPGNLSVVENRSAVVSRTNTAEKHQYSVSRCVWKRPELAVVEDHSSRVQFTTNPSTITTFVATQILPFLPHPGAKERLKATLISSIRWQRSKLLGAQIQ